MTNNFSIYIFIPRKKYRTVIVVKVSGNAKRREIFERFPFFLDKFICVTAAQGWDSSISISIKSKSSVARGWREGRVLQIV